MMKDFLKKPKEKLRELAEMDRNLLVYKVLPNAFLEALHKYFRLEAEGIEHIPRRGPAVIAANHSGFAGLDAMLLPHEINKYCHRIPRVLTHKFWFLNRWTAFSANKVGFVEANMTNAILQLNKNNLVLIFPEGEHGNFKPTRDRYQLREFKRGFVRMAIEAGCPIIPALVIGAEETNINLSQIKIFGNAVLPLPLNIIPLPAKWKIKFLPPVKLPYKTSALHDQELISEVADEIRESMQAALTKEVSQRKSVFL